MDFEKYTQRLTWAQVVLPDATGNIVSTEAEYIFAATGGRELRANFALFIYPLSIPFGTGYTITAEPGSFSFKVSHNGAFSLSPVIVKVNGTLLAAVNGVYTISNITEEKTISVAGIVLNTANNLSGISAGQSFKKGDLTHLYRQWPGYG